MQQKLCLSSLRGSQSQLSHGELRTKKDHGGYCSMSTLEIYVVCSPLPAWICADDPQCSDLHSFCDNVNLTPLLLLELIHHPTLGNPRNICRQRCPLEYPLGLVAFMTLFVGHQFSWSLL